MNTAIVSASGSYAGLGFAVPVDTVNRIVPQLIKFGSVKKLVLGVQLLESRYLRPEGIPGAIVANVLPGSPADKAGIIPLQRDATGAIQLGDIITSIDDTPVEDGDDLFRVLDDKQPGDKIKLMLINNGEERSVTIKLGALRR